MTRIAILLLALLPAFAQTSPEKRDPWSKVQQLKVGTELRIYKTGNGPLVMAEFADVTEDSLIVIIKKVETAIPKSVIDRIDSRPPGWSHSTAASRQAEGAHDAAASASTLFGSKPDFQIVYRRLVAVKPAQ